MSGQANPLRYTDIRRYAGDHGLPLSETVAVLQAMDDAYFAVHAAAAKKQQALQQRTARR